MGPARLGPYCCFRFPFDREGFIAVLMEDSSNLLNTPSRIVICAGFLFWAYMYFSLSETKWKILFGAAQIIAALASDWYQWGKIGQEGVNFHFYDRIVFLAGGLAVIAHGMKDIKEGLKARVEPPSKRSVHE